MRLIIYMRIYIQIGNHNPNVTNLCEEFALTRNTRPYKAGLLGYTIGFVRAFKIQLDHVRVG